MPAIYVPEGTDSVANTTADDAQNRPAVTWLEDGLHYMVVWTSLEPPPNAEIRARVFNADGSPVDVDFLVATGPDSQAGAHIAPLAGGGFVVVWGDSTVGTAGIWGRVYDAALTGGAPILLKAGLPTNVYEPSVSGFATGGGFVVSWTADDETDTNVQAQVFTAAGLPSGPEVTANTNLTGGQFESAVAALSNGNYVVVWQDGNGAEAPEIRMAIYTQAGVLVPGSEQLVNTTTLDTQEVPTVTALAGGGFVVAWVDYSLTGGDATGSDIRAQIFDSAGGTVGSELLVNGTAPGAQTEAGIAALADGGFVVSWTSANGTDDDIRAQRFDAGGTKLGAETLIPSDPDGNQAESAVSVSPANGDLVVTWTDYGTLAAPSPGDIEQRLFDLHSFPTVDLNGPGAGLDHSTAYTEGGAGAAIAAAALEITQDSEHPILTITITITDAAAGDQLTLAGALPAGITSSAPGGTTLTLTNSGASADDLEQALLLVRYSTTSDNPTAGPGNADRTISILANDGPLSSDLAVATVAVTATNDPAAIGGTDTGSVTEDGTLTAAGLLTVLDPDTGESSFQAVTGAAGTYGSLDLDSAGNWTYTLNNAAANVQALGAGAQPTDTITVHSFDGTAHDIAVTVNGTNDAQVLTGLATSATFAENTVNATPQLLDGDVTFSDPEDNFDGGTVTVSGLLAEDRVAIRNEGTDPGQISVSGVNVSYGNIVIGTVAGGVGGTLTVTLNAAATSAAVDALIQNLTYANVSDTPAATRTLIVNVTDADGADFGPASVPATFAPLTGAANPFNGFDVGFYATPIFADLDNDGDLDAVVGQNDGLLVSFRNNGNGTYTDFGVSNPFAGMDFGTNSSPAFVDLDNDTDLDLVVGDTNGMLRAFANNAGTFSELVGGANPFLGIDVGDDANPAFADIDGDNDLDLVVGNNAGQVLTYRNAGGAYTLQVGPANPFDAVALGGRATPDFVDLDGDGDLDAVIGALDGQLYAYRNDSGVFTPLVGAANPFNTVDIGVTSSPSFADLDGDGDMDAVVGEYEGALYTFENTTPPGEAIIVNVTAQNDAAAISGTTSGSVTEAGGIANGSPGTPQATGNLDADDVDNPDDSWTAASGARTYGSYVLGADGAWTYTLDNDNSAVQALNTGSTPLTDTFTAVTVDGTQQVVTITINGANDAAVLSSDTRNLTETNLAADISSSGTLTISEVDSPATFVAQGGTVGTYGTFAIDAAGAWTYTASSAHNEFADGVTYTDTFPVSSADGTATSVTINILGTNDAAILSADVRNLTETNLAADISSSGTLTISDVDSPATFVAQGGTAGSYGTFAIDAGGVWTYVASSAHNEFVDGVTYTDTFPVSSADGTTTSVTINILGTNDAAVLSADVRDLTETNLAADISSSGTLTISDADSPATFVAQGGTVGTYGTFAIDAAGAWTYTASSAHNEFVGGVTYTDTFPVSSADGTTTSVTINILGTNDAAILSADTRNLTETNLAADISSSGTLTISDVDSSATFVAQGGTVGLYGTFAIDTAGAWTYTASSAHNEFAAGVTYTDTFSVSAADGTLTSVTINILGTNDAAVLSADVRDLTETNLAADISSSGALTISDVDSPATFVAQPGTVGTYGTFAIDTAGAWTYTASSAHDEFVGGVTYTDTFSVASADGTTTSVTINILGTNDAAVLSADVRDLTETNLAADISSSGTLTISDVDSPETFVAQGGTVGLYGTFAIDTAGAWTYTASSAHNEFAAGVTYTDTFSVASADGTTTSVTIDILGTNDAPEGVDHALTFTEDVPHVFAATDFTFTDVENDDFFSVTIATLPAVGTGIIYYDADGAGSTFAPVAISAGQAFTAADLADGRLTYVPPTNVNGIGSASFTYQVRDDAGTDNGGADFDTSANTINIDLTAVNDAPTVAIAPPGTADEHIALSLKGAISVGDVDSASDTIQVTVSVGYGILTADPTGSGAIVSGGGSSAITVTGTLAQVQAFLGSGGPSTLFYTPNTDNPPASTTLTVTVDDGGHNGTGGTLTATANQSINIVQINDAPSGFDHDITASENTPRALNPVDFAYTDPEGHGFAAVTIVTLPTQGTLMYDADGPGGPGAPVAVTAGTTFTAAQLVGAKLVYRADPDESGAGYATFTYIVRDNGGTDHGGLDTDPGANTITINVNAFNNGPTVTDLDNDSPTFFEDTPAGVVWLDEGRDAVISDLDSADFNGGSLTVRIVVNKVVTEDELVLITGTNGVTLTAGEVFVDGISIGTYSGGGLGEDLVFTLNAGATPASITRLIHNLSYLNTDTVEPNTAQRLVEFRLLDGDGGSMSAYTTINVVSVDDPATAGADAATTDEASAVTIIVLANDDDIDGPPPSVAAVNGNPISVGTPIILPSGALLTLNADGTFTYDPNHAFDTTPTGGSGASNTPELDEFSYTLAVNGGTANVSVTITGLDTDDFLFGTAGADALSGGTGNDFYFVDQASDAVVEAPGQGFDVVWTTMSYILAAGTDVEVLSARFWEGTDPLALTGNELANTLYGNAGANALDGGGGNDTLIGMGGNDALTGGSGVDTMYGGSGDDFYFVDDAADAVIETAGQGYDVVWASTSYILATGTDVEALSARFWEGIDALSLTGNGLANTLYGNAGANALDGSGGNDTLFGFGGNDALTGGAGADLMYGGAGDDFYYVDNALDVAAESASEGHDAVWTTVNYTLGAGTEIEILSARFWEGTDPLSLTGNELANAVYGNAGANSLDGGGGNDTLFGMDGNDSLTGGTGADTMYGGAGDDFYFVDNALDRPIETAGQGYDVVWSLVSYILAGGTQIEALSAASWEGTSALSLTGNELANAIYGNAGVNMLDGADGNDTLFGREGDDTLFGGGGADLIYGGAGADSMHGGAGADVMVGGAGDDFYFVENALDAAAEGAGEGYDVVWASVSYTLAADTEVETLSAISWEANTAINLTGNGFDNTLYGNAGANILNGGGGNDTLFGLGGNDTLIGGAGADSFLFNTALGAGNIDTIADFSAPDDTIVLDHLRFVGLGVGPIEEGNFTIGTGANDDDDRIIYDPATGALYYDADGGGGDSAVQFATLQGAPAITFGDFTVI